MGDPIYRNLTVKLSEEELKQRASQQAGVYQQYWKVDEEKKVVNKDYANKLGTLKKELDRLSLAVQNHEEVRAVECEWHPNFATNEMELMRCDTGELVQKRDMTEKERQENLLDLPGVKTSSDDPFAPKVEETEEEKPKKKRRAPLGKFNDSDALN